MPHVCILLAQHHASEEEGWCEARHAHCCGEAGAASCYWRQTILSISRATMEASGQGTEPQAKSGDLPACWRPPFMADQTSSSACLDETREEIDERESWSFIEVYQQCNWLWMSTQCCIGHMNESPWKQSRFRWLHHQIGQLVWRKN